MKPSLMLASLAVLLAPLAAGAEDWRWGEIVREELFATHFAEFPDAEAVVLLDHGIARVDAKYRLKLRRHARTKIMEEAGLDRAIVRIPYAEGEEIKDFRAHTIVPPGHELKVEKQHVREEREGARRVMVVTFPGAQKGVVLEWEYELRTDRIDTLPEWPFQGRDPVRVSRFELQLPPGMNWEAAYPWAPGVPPAPVKTTINDPEEPSRQLEQAAWELHNQAPVPELPFLPYPAEYRLTLHVQLQNFASTYKSFPVKRSWEELSGVLAADVAERLADAEGVTEWAGGAATASGGARERAAALYARVRDGLKTDPPRPDVGPAAPRVVVEAGHGTAVEKNLVLLALLRAASLPADPVYVRTRACGLFEAKRTDPTQFDHIIVRLAAEGGTTWMDASAICPFGMLPPTSRVTAGLLATAEGGGIVDVTAPATETSRTVTTSATVDRHGTLEATSLVTLTGDRALAARCVLAKEGETAWAERLLRTRFGDSAVLEGATVTGLSDPSAPLALEAKYRVPAFARSEGEQLRCPAPFLETVAADALPDDGRSIPVEFPFAGASREDVTVAVPEGYLLETVPSPAKARTADLSLRTAFAKTEGAFTATREVDVLETVIEDEEFPRLRGFFANVQSADGAEIVLRPSSFRSALTR